jgi:DNA mismatch endonuclease (patch repair protein)
MERILKRKLKKGIFSNVTPERSKIMSAIRGKHNKSTELKLRMALVNAGIKGWILHPSYIFGKPDIFFTKKKLAIFVDGCFWHGCKLCGHIPKTRSPFWKTKFDRNKARASAIKLNLSKKSIKVLRVWEHVLKKPKYIKVLVQDILKIK